MTNTVDVDLSVLPTLTDDELLAVILNDEQGGEVYRPGALPTVDVDDRDAVLAAVFRGQRSLGVRGLASELGAGPAIEVLGTLLRTVPPGLVLYLAGPDLEMRTFAGATIWRSLDGDTLLSQSVGAVGVHGFSTHPLRDVGDDVADLMLRFAHETESEQAGPLWLCLAAYGEAGVEVIAATKGEGAWVRRTPGAADVRAPVAVGDLGMKVGALVRALAPQSRDDDGEV